MPLPPTSQAAARSSSSRSANSPQAASTSTSAPPLVQPAAALSSLKSTSTCASGAFDELLRGGRHFRHPRAPSSNSLYLPDTDEHASAGALAQDAPDWWGWGGGGLVGGGMAPNSSAGSSYARKRTGILSGGDAWQRFMRPQSETGGSDSESEAESARSATLSGRRASKGSPFSSGGHARYEADEQPQIASDWGEDEGIVSTLEPPSKAAAANSQAKAAQSRQQRKEAEMFAHIRTKLKRLALHHAKYHMEHGAHEYEHAHAQQQQLEQNHAHMMQQQQTPTRMQTQQAVVNEQVHKEVHPETQQLSPPNPAAEEEARELASAAQTIHQHAQVAEVLCEQEEHASAAQGMREHAPLAEELCGQEELASLFDLPPEEDSSAEAATHAILHPFSALLPTQPQDFSSCMASLCTPPTPPTSSRSLFSHQQHPGASSQQQQQNSNSSLRSVSQHSRQQQQQQQQNSNNSLLSISQHSRQQQQQQQQNSHSSLLPTSLHSSGRSRKALSLAHAPSQPASASLFLHGRSGHTSMDSIDLEEEPGNGIVIDSSGKPFAYRRIDTMHARLPDSPKVSHSETPVLGGSSGGSSSGQQSTSVPPSPINLHRVDANTSSRLPPISSAPEGDTNQNRLAYGAHSHGLALLFGAPSPLSSASQAGMGLDVKSISGCATCTAPGSALGHRHPDDIDAMASLFEDPPSCADHQEGAIGQSKMGAVSEMQAHQEGPGAEVPGCLNDSVLSGVEGGGGGADPAGVGAGVGDANGACVEGGMGVAEGGQRDPASLCSEGVAAGKEEAEGQGEEAILAALLTNEAATLGADSHAGISGGGGFGPSGPSGANTLPQRTWQRSLSCTATEAEVAGKSGAAATPAAAAAAAPAARPGSTQYVVHPNASALPFTTTLLSPRQAYVPASHTTAAAAKSVPSAAPYRAASTGQLPDFVRPAAPAPAPPLRVASPAIMAALAARARLRQQRGTVPFRRGHTLDALPCLTPDGGLQKRALLARLLRRQHKRSAQQQYTQSPSHGNTLTAVQAAGVTPFAASGAPHQGGGAFTQAMPSAQAAPHHSMASTGAMPRPHPSHAPPVMHPPSSRAPSAAATQASPHHSTASTGAMPLPHPSHAPQVMHPPSSRAPSAAAAQAAPHHSTASTEAIPRTHPPHLLPEYASQTVPACAVSSPKPPLLPTGTPFSEPSPAAPLPALTPASSIPASATLTPASSIPTTTQTSASTAPGAIDGSKSTRAAAAVATAAAVPDNPNASSIAERPCPAKGSGSERDALHVALFGSPKCAAVGAAAAATPQRGITSGSSSGGGNRTLGASTLSFNGRLRSMLSGGGGSGKRATTKSTSLNRSRVNHIGTSSGSESSSSGSNLVGSLVTRLRKLSRNEAARNQLQQQQQDQHTCTL